MCISRDAYDTTSLALFGQYDYDTWANAPIPAHGHSKDHRPDLKQIVVTLITNGPAGVPLFYDSHDGNSSDKTTFHESIALMRDFYSQLEDTPDFMWVADSALYSQNKLQQSPVTWLTRVPATVKKVKHYCRQEADEFDWADLNNGYRCVAVKGPKGEYWQLIDSAKGRASQLKTLEKKIMKERLSQSQALKKTTNTLYACEHDARKAVNVLAKKFKYHRAVEQSIEAEMAYEKLGEEVMTIYQMN